MQGTTQQAATGEIIAQQDNLVEFFSQQGIDLDKAHHLVNDTIAGHYFDQINAVTEVERDDAHVFLAALSDLTGRNYRVK